MKKVEVTKEEAQGLHEMGLEVSCRVTYNCGVSYFMTLHPGRGFEGDLFFAHYCLSDIATATYYVNEEVMCD